MFVSMIPVAVDGVGPLETSAAIGSWDVKASPSGARLCAASIRLFGGLRHASSGQFWFERAARPQKRPRPAA
jgi:hypothetical protein